MQQPSNPHGFNLELWHGFAASTFLAILAAIRLWLNRKKPNAEIHETEARTKRTNAEARKIEAETSRDIGEIVLAMSEKITEAQQLYDAQGERHRQQVEFLQKQIEIKTNDEHTARSRAHAALNEVSRCVMVIRDHEEKMRGADVQFQPFKFKTQEEIMREGVGNEL